MAEHQGIEGRRFLAIALVSAAVLVLQIATTRILSVVIWYHWAFFAISLAMLGVGAPGVWFALRTPSPDLLPALLRRAAIAIPLAVIGMIKASPQFTDTAIIWCLLCLLPAMLALGAAVCLLLLEARGPAVGRMYAFDLLGAFAGALAVIPLMTFVPTPELAAGVAFLPLAASLLLEPRRWAPCAAIAVGLVLLFQWAEPFRVRHSKNYVEMGATRPLYERWSPTARVTVFPQPFGASPTQPFGWGFGNVPPTGPSPEQYWLEQDGAAGTPITRLDQPPTELRYLLHDVTTVGYQLRRPERAAIIGGGGGRDILGALAAGTKSVDAIEINSATVDLLRGPLREFSGGVYDLPGVHAIVGEGRSVLTRSAGGYDLIQISLIDSWAASSAGAYALSEANLYTVEAYRLYWARLGARGLVSTSRWLAGDLQLEIPRLLFLVRAALVQEGVADPRQHIALVQGGMVGTVLVSKSAFSDMEKIRLRELAATYGFALHLPESTLPEVEQTFARALAQGPAAIAPPGFDLAPPTDDRPFFFQMMSPFGRVSAEAARAHGANAEGVVALRRLMAIMAAATLVLFFAPFALGRWVKRAAGFWRGSLYFAAIGLAFMLVEVAWIQRFILYLGHPSLAITVALGCLLLGAGLGSMVSGRVGVAGGQRFGFALPLVLALVNPALGPVFHATLGWPLALRGAVTVLALVPSGFLMGFCFPLGMVRFGDANKPWFWALNGAAGVLASVGSLAVSMKIGFTRVAFVGACLYFAAWLLVRGRAVDSAGPISPPPAP